jgi:NAD(P)-dependent dehydrogenase (short-subunit alcohol dehydrogenase family)
VSAPAVDLAKTPSFRLDGKRALVTGGGRGIGLAAASALAQAGAHVTLAARTQAEIEAAAQAIRGRGDRAAALPLDVTDLDAVRDAIGKAEPFDVLVNNAGTNRPKLLMDVSVEDFDVIMGLNVRAAFFMAQAVARSLIAAKQPGSIINISSQMGHVGAARRTVYCASKHAMEGFTKAMAIELAPHNIRVNSLGPTFLETPLTRPFFENKAFRDEVLGKIKLGRLGQLDELTGAILFLASDASSLMTGSALVLDGGWTAERLPCRAASPHVRTIDRADACSRGPTSSSHRSYVSQLPR